MGNANYGEGDDRRWIKLRWSGERSGKTRVEEDARGERGRGRRRGLEPGNHA